MTGYSPVGARQRMALALAAGVTALATMSSSALLFSDARDREWIAVAMGLATPALACTGGAAALAPGCTATQPARLAHAAMAASAAGYGGYGHRAGTVAP